MGTLELALEVCKGKETFQLQEEILQSYGFKKRHV